MAGQAQLDITTKARCAGCPGAQLALGGSRRREGPHARRSSAGGRTTSRSRPHRVGRQYRPRPVRAVRIRIGTRLPEERIAGVNRHIGQAEGAGQPGQRREYPQGFSARRVCLRGQPLLPRVRGQGRDGGSSSAGEHAPLLIIPGQNLHS